MICNQRLLIQSSELYFQECYTHTLTHTHTHTHAHTHIYIYIEREREGGDCKLEEKNIRNMGAERLRRRKREYNQRYIGTRGEKERNVDLYIYSCSLFTEIIQTKITAHVYTQKNT